MSPKPAILEQPAGWLHLQTWFHDHEDPLRPWNISAISRQLQLPQAVVRALLRGPKDSPGMTRTAFTGERLKQFEQLFSAYGYQPVASTPMTAAGRSAVKKGSRL